MKKTPVSYIKSCKIAVFTTLIALITSCNCNIPLKVTPIQQHDKNLSCKNIILEVNEAEHLRSEARKNKRIGFGEILMPFCWISKYSSSKESEDSINSRIKYLKDIFALLNCDEELQEGENHQSPLQNNIYYMPRQTTIPYKKPKTIKNTTPAPPTSYYNPNAITGVPVLGYRPIKNTDDPWLHEHIPPNGKPYQHSHPHDSPHRHLSQ